MERNMLPSPRASIVLLLSSSSLKVLLLKENQTLYEAKGDRGDLPGTVITGSNENELFERLKG